MSENVIKTNSLDIWLLKYVRLLEIGAIIQSGCERQ